MPQLLHDSTKTPHLRLEQLQALERRTCGLNTQNRSGNRQERTFPQAEWGRAGATIAPVKAVATSCLALRAGSGLSCVNLWGPGQELDKPRNFWELNVQCQWEPGRALRCDSRTETSGQCDVLPAHSSLCPCCQAEYLRTWNTAVLKPQSGSLPHERGRGRQAMARSSSASSFLPRSWAMVEFSRDHDVPVLALGCQRKGTEATGAPWE